MNKRIYTQPTCTIVGLKPARIICTSGGGIDEEEQTISVYEIEVEEAW